jgi:hypothetical protein
MATSNMDKFDDLFFGILQNCEQIEPFLDVVFSFLARRTDFLRVMHNKTDKMGFPPGVAEKMLLKVDSCYKMSKYMKWSTYYSFSLIFT